LERAVPCLAVGRAKRRVAKRKEVKSALKKNKHRIKIAVQITSKIIIVIYCSIQKKFIKKRQGDLILP
jgi:hypothetical protein